MLKGNTCEPHIPRMPADSRIRTPNLSNKITLPLSGHIFHNGTAKLYLRYVACIYWWRDSSVGVATGYGLNGRGSIPQRGKTYFFLSEASRPSLEPIQAFQFAQGTLSSGIKQPDRDVKNCGAMSPFPHTSSWRVTIYYIVYFSNENILKWIICNACFVHLSGSQITPK
jgi:hypothetical protein